MTSSSLFANLPPPAKEDEIKLQVDPEPEARDLKKRKLCEEISRSTENAQNVADDSTKNPESGNATAQAPPDGSGESNTEKASCTVPVSGGNPAGDQVGAALIKIANHIGQAKKFTKASELLRKLFSQQVLDERHGALLFDALQTAMSDPQRAFDPLLAREYSKLFTTASRHSHLFTSAQRSQLDGYGIWAVVRNEMMTDDSFMFNKTLGNIKKMILELPEVEAGSEDAELEEAALARLRLPIEERASSLGGSNSEISGSLWSDVEMRAMRRAALLDCVCTGRDCYAHAWARTSVDLLVDHAKAQEGRFLPSQRAQILEMVTFVRDQRAGRKLGPSAKETARDSTTFERARADWGRAAVSHRGKVGASGDTAATFNF